MVKNGAGKGNSSHEILEWWKHSLGINLIQLVRQTLLRFLGFFGPNLDHSSSWLIIFMDFLKEPAQKDQKTPQGDFSAHCLWQTELVPTSFSCPDCRSPLSPSQSWMWLCFGCSSSDFCCSQQLWATVSSPPSAQPGSLLSLTLCLSKDLAPSWGKLAFAAQGPLEDTQLLLLSMQVKSLCQYSKSFWIFYLFFLQPSFTWL